MYYLAKEVACIYLTNKRVFNSIYGAVERAEMTNKMMLAQLSMNELTGRILDMAQTGVYRESLFEAFRSIATKRQVREAIALAKQFGLRSDSSLRDSELGTYYQVDPSRVESFQSAIQSAMTLQPGDDLALRIQLAARTVKLMLLVSGASAIALLLIGASYVLTGKAEAAAAWWTSALCAGGIWLWQKTVAKPLLTGLSCPKSSPTQPRAT